MKAEAILMTVCDCDSGMRDEFFISMGFAIASRLIKLQLRLHKFVAAQETCLAQTMRISRTHQSVQHDQVNYRVIQQIVACADQLLESKFYNYAAEIFNAISSHTGDRAVLVSSPSLTSKLARSAALNR